MKDKGTLLLLDFSNIFYRGLHVHLNLAHRGEPTGGLYGLIIQLVKLVNEFKPSMVLLCGDSPPYLRTKEYPAYKARRKKQDGAMRRIVKCNLKLCDQFFSALGEPLQKEKGLEADDLIAIYAENYERSYEKIVAVSNDSDLYQLLDQNNLYLYSGTGDNKVMITGKTFFDKYPFKRAATWVKVVAYTGGHNDLPGIYGVGEVTAVKLLSSADKAWINKRRELRLVHGTKLKLSEHLATLPYPEVKAEDFCIIPREPYDRVAMRDFLRSTGVEFSPSMERAFDHLGDVKEDYKWNKVLRDDT